MNWENKGLPACHPANDVQRCIAPGAARIAPHTHTRTDVRPPLVLEAALRLIKARWVEDADYEHANTQLKSVRQVRSTPQPTPHPTEPPTPTPPSCVHVLKRARANAPCALPHPRGSTAASARYGGSSADQEHAAPSRGELGEGCSHCSAMSTSSRCAPGAHPPGVRFGR